jgi:hypothetical protein
MAGLWRSGFLPALVFQGSVIPALAYGAVAPKKPRLVVLGAVKQVPYSKSGDRAGAGPTETTPRTRALRINDSLSGEKTGDKPTPED